MVNLVDRLRDEADLTEEQALKVLSIIKEHMDNNDMKIDWNKFFKGKLDDFTEKIQEISSKVNEKAEPYVDKVSGAVDEFMAKAKKSAHDLSMKAADFFDEEKK